MSPTPSGIIPITAGSFKNGAGTPQSNAMQQGVASSNRLHALNQFGQGRGNKRSKCGGSTNTVSVPQFQMPYQSTGGPETNPNAQIAAGAQTGMQANENARYDGQAKMGGHKGGNPNWKWGCLNGGKSRRRPSRKLRKQRKKTRRRRRH